MELSDELLEINILLWAYDIQKANEIAIKILNSDKIIKNKNNFFSLFEKDLGYKINLFLRSPKVFTLSNPTGITNILIIYLSENAIQKQNIKNKPNPELSEAKKYLDTRKKIPFKILTSEKLSSNELEIHCKNIPLSDLTCENGKNLLIKEIELYEITLKKVFEKFDKQKNGLINYEDLIKASKQLGYTLTEDDTKMIISTLEQKNKGNINFESFKKWWILGRSDFVNFRRVCKARIFMDDFFKNTKYKLNDYFVNIKNEGKQIINDELNQTFDINIHSENHFDNGIGLFVQFCNGAEALDIIETKFEEFRNSELGFGLKLKFENAQSAKNNLEIVEKFINEIICSFLGDISSLIIGPIFKFKVSENFVIIYFADKRPKPDTLLSEFKSIFSGTLHIFTQLNFDDMISLSIEEFIEKFFIFKIHFNSNLFNIKDSIKKMICQIKLLQKNVFDKNEKDNQLDLIKNNNNLSFNFTEIFKYLMEFFELYLILKNVKLDISYDAKCLKKEFFQIISNIREKIEKEKGEEIKYDQLQGQEDFLLDSPANLENLDEKILGYFNLLDFFLCEIKEYYKEIKKDKEILKDILEEENIGFLDKIDLNEIILEIHSKNIITPIYGKFTFKIPGLKKVINSILID